MKKSTASTLAACACRKLRHEERVRSGAGWRPASSSTLRTDVAETLMPRPLSSPTIRLYPQCEFSRARRRIRSRSERSSGGRPCLPMCVRPAARDKLAVPAQQCVRFDCEVRPSRSRHRATERSQQRPIRTRKSRPSRLTPKNRKLVTQEQDLELLRATRPCQQPHQREQIPQREIDERPEQAAPPRPTARARNLTSRTPTKSRGRVCEPYARHARRDATSRFRHRLLPPVQLQAVAAARTLDVTSRTRRRVSHLGGHRGDRR